MKINILVILALTFPSVILSATSLNTERLQLNMQEKMTRLRGKAKYLANNQGAFQLHQIKRYCRPELEGICKKKELSDNAVVCLVKNQKKLSSQCQTVVRNGFQGPPTRVDMVHHNVIIPKGSQYFFIPKDRSLGVALSKVTYYHGIPIMGVITWFDGGNIRSFTPFNTAVNFGTLVLAPNKKITFSPSGKVIKGVLNEDPEKGIQQF